MDVLLVEDDNDIRNFVADGLFECGSRVACADNGQDGLALAQSENFDILIVDIELPKMNGLKLVRELRNNGFTTPVIILTNYSDIEYKLEGFNEAEVDDYLTKPVDIIELNARLQAIYRRANAKMSAAVLKFGDLTLDCVKRQVFRQDQLITLESKQFQILEVLMRNSNEVVTKKMLQQQVWNRDFNAQGNVIESHISRLRSKVDKPFAQGNKDLEMIKTVYRGYKLTAQSESEQSGA